MDPFPAKAHSFFQDCKARRRNIKILVIGDCGSGKTTLVNNLLGEEIAQELRVTSILSTFQGVFKDVPVTVHETSGLENPDAEGDTEFSEDMRSLLRGGKLDVIIYCLKATETKMRNSLINSLRRYHNMGLDWRKTVIALTFADVLPIPRHVRQARSYDPVRYFNARVAEWKQTLVQTLTNRIGLPIGLARELKVAPTTGDPAEELLNHEKWFRQIWSNVVDAIKAAPFTYSDEKTFTVIYPYDGKLDDELAMKPGDVITVDDWTASNAWAWGTLNGKRGLFYKAFVEASSKVPSPNDCKLKKVRGKPMGYDACYQGREYVLKEKLDEVDCIICYELADNAHQTSCCGSTVCLQCANKWKERRNSCPQCRKGPLRLIEDPKTQRRITGATVYCPNYPFGCVWVNGIGWVAQHLAADCEIEGKECPHQQCKEVVPKKLLERHIFNLCLWRLEACPCCEPGKLNFGDKATKSYHDIITSHHLECPRWPARCPNLCNPYLKLTQSNVGRHVKEECPSTLVACKFAQVGCKERRRRNDMPGHMKDALSDHVTAMFEDYMKLKRENEELKLELNQLKQHVKKK